MLCHEMAQWHFFRCSRSRALLEVKHRLEGWGQAFPPPIVWFDSLRRLLSVLIQARRCQMSAPDSFCPDCCKAVLAESAEEWEAIALAGDILPLMHSRHHWLCRWACEGEQSAQKWDLHALARESERARERERERETERARERERERERAREREREREDIYIYIYIYAVVLLSGPSLAFWGVIFWAKFVFYKTLFVKKHYKNRGFSTFFLKKKIARANLRCYYLGQVGHF